MFQRHFNPLLSRSFFLFGARASGKSTLLKSIFRNQPHLRIDLLDREEEDRFRVNLRELVNRVAAHPKGSWVIIDEVQKIPRLLDDVQQLVKAYRFALTGSSARKLKRGGANLLAGRANIYALYPLTFYELGDSFSLSHVLNWGSLPELYELENDIEREQFLRAYALTYLKEEIWGEQFVRNLDPFRSFLSVAAQMNGKLINFTGIGRDVGVDTKTVQSYYQILTDTLVGTLIEPHHRSIRKRQRQAPKFYFFDTGIQRALSDTLDQPVKPTSYQYGNVFEHFIVNEVVKLNAYQRHPFSLSYMRTEDDVEIDLLLERGGKVLWALEIKSTDQVQAKHVRHLKQLGKDLGAHRLICISRDNSVKQIDGVLCHHWRTGLDLIFSDKHGKLDPGLELHEVVDLK